MLQRLRRGYLQLAGSAAQVAVLAVGAQFESPLGWSITFALVAAISLLSWTLAMKHVRAITDTPTSRVASAAQGYVELVGSGRPLAGTPVLAQLTQTPCLWFRYLVERRSDKKWVTEQQGRSDTSFILDDGSGECLVDPEGAEVINEIRQRWTEGNRRYTEWRIIEGETVYAIGQFLTRAPVSLEIRTSEEVKALLSEWKQDAAGLRSRFDLNGDGEIDLREWELARAQARREVLAKQREVVNEGDLHVMHMPSDRRLYLISTLPAEQVVRRYRWWALFHLLCFFSSLAALGYFLRTL